MRPIREIPVKTLRNVDYVLMDIDDTITSGGILSADAFMGIHRLKERGYRVAPITGRPAGWCDHLARMWPIDAVVGENGAFYFYYDGVAKKLRRRYVMSGGERAEARAKLDAIEKEILSAYPGAAVASDQAYREADLAIDFCEDVPVMSMEDVKGIAAIFEKHGARAKISSIHVNGWFGSYDKLSTTALMFKELFQVDLERVRDKVIFVGDSPNDSPMFGYFKNSVGVANVKDFEGMMENYPAWVTTGGGGPGFAEVAKAIISAGE